MCDNTQSNSMPEIAFGNLLEQYSFSVPEIQREYVWGADEKILSHFVASLQEQEIKKHLGSAQYNIGFLYSYTPDYASKDQKISYLIDGQQRFTTVYLLAFYTAIKEKSENYDEYKYFGELSKKFTYRVRHTTAEFLRKLIKNVEELADFVNIKNQKWFLSSYEHDISIMNMLSLFKTLGELDKVKPLPSHQNILATTFCFFNIANTGQGEELYITMNSRGKLIENNEILRAYLFEQSIGDSEAETWAKKFDTWQEFFWKHRGQENTADSGFDAFINWIVIIENHTKRNEKAIEFKDVHTITTKDYFSLLNFRCIEKYFTALEVIEKYFNELGEAGKFLRKFAIKDILCGKMDSKKSYMFILPLLAFVANGLIKDQGKYEFNTKIALYSWVRFFYNIAYNKESEALQEALKLVACAESRAMCDIINLLNVPDIEKNALTSTIFNDEEMKKLQLYHNASDKQERQEREHLLWEAEDTSLWKGSILSLIEWSHASDGIAAPNQGFNDEKFEKITNILNDALNNDLFRRALLARKLPNYPFQNKSNMSFACGDGQWRTLFNESNPIFFSTFFDEFCIDKSTMENLEAIVHSPSEAIENWKELFISYPQLLNFCHSKNIRFTSNGSVLIQSETWASPHANLYSYIFWLKAEEVFRGDFTKYKEFNNEEMTARFYDRDYTCTYFDLPKYAIAIDVICCSISGDFKFSIFSRHEESTATDKHLQKLADKYLLEFNKDTGGYYSAELPEKKTVSTLKEIFRMFSTDPQ